jgi:hypothetical protein
VLDWIVAWWAGSRRRVPRRVAEPLLAAGTLVLVPAVVLAAGIARFDLALAGGAALLAVRAFSAWMSQRAPWDAWRAAIRCAAAGSGALLLAGLLLLALALALRGLWTPGTTSATSAAVLVLGWALIAAVDRHARSVAEWSIVGVVGVLAAVVVWTGWQAPAAAQHAAVALCGLALAARGWRLLRFASFALEQTDR